MVSGFGEPLIDRITYNPKADLATADELADEFLGGVILSLLLSGGERLSSWQKSGNGISEREVIDRLMEMGIPSEIAREYAAQTAQAASVLINAGKPVSPSLQRAVKRPTKAPLTLPEDRGTMETANYTRAGRELADGLRAYNRLEKNGFEYTLNETSAGWIGRLHDVRGNKFGGMISNARALDYQTQALGSREEAIDTLVQVAERNNLLGDNPGPHVRMSPEEARIRAEEAARNAPPLPKRMEEAPTLPTAEMDAADESTIVNDDPADHTKAEQRVIEEYKNSVDNRLLEWIRRVKTALNKGDQTATKMRLVLNSVSSRAIAEIKRLTGIDVSGFAHIIDGSAVQHIENRHGENGARDNTMRDDADFARIQYVLDNFDRADIVFDKYGNPDKSNQFFDKNNRNAPLVKFSKKVNGTYYVVEAVPDSADKKLHIVSAYFDNNSGSNIQELNIDGNPPPQPTPEAPLGPDASADDSVAQTGEAVNTQALNLPKEPEAPAKAEAPLRLPAEQKEEHNKQVDLGRGNDVQGSDAGRRGSELPAEQTPWQEYLEWYTRQIGELTRRQLSPPEERETIWQRYLHQHEQDLWEHNRQRVKASTEIGYQEGDTYEFGRETEEESGSRAGNDEAVRGVAEKAERRTGTGGKENAGALEKSTRERANRLRKASYKPRKGSVEYDLVTAAKNKYGLEVVIVPRSVWEAERGEGRDPEDIPYMSTWDGAIYSRDELSEEEKTIGLAHEPTHAMEQLGYEPYLDLLDDVPSFYSMFSDDGSALFGIALDHQRLEASQVIDYPGDNEARQEEKAQARRTVYSEILSTVYGYASVGKTSGSSKRYGYLDFSNAFSNIDEVIGRLRKLHDDFGTWNKNRQNGKSSTEIDTDYLVAVNTGDMETAQRIPAEQTPWREYLEWYTRKIGELTRLRLSPPEELETVWQRYLRQYEKDREIEKALKTVEILGTVSEEYAELLEEAPGTDALVALRHWEDRHRRNNGNHTKAGGEHPTGLSMQRKLPDHAPDSGKNESAGRSPALRDLPAGAVFQGPQRAETASRTWAEK